jgi:hypothetical protein
MTLCDIIRAGRRELGIESMRHNKKGLAVNTAGSQLFPRVNVSLLLIESFAAE